MVLCAVIAKGLLSIELLHAKRTFFCILQVLRIHTGLNKWSKRNLFYIHLQKMNPFGIHETCIKIANSEVLFEQYILAINEGKYDIEVQNDDAIKRNRIFYHFMKKTFNRMDELYLRERCLLIDAIMKYQTRKQSAA